MNNKNYVSIVIPKSLQLIETQYNAKVKVIRSNNALELSFNSLLKSKGIVHFFLCTYTPQQNFVVKRKHQHILYVARSLLFQSHVPLEYWGDCNLTAVYLINRTPSHFLGNKSPFRLITYKVPSYDHLKVLGVSVLSLLF